jgi:Putative Ig domain
MTSSFRLSLLSIIVFCTLASSYAGNTVLVLDSREGDPVGKGLHYYFRSTDGTFSAQKNNTSSVTVFFETSTNQLWNLSFGSADGTPLAAGKFYDGATRYPFNNGTGWPGIDISGNGVGCNNETGSFTVYEIAYGTGSTITAFHASFEQSCEGADPPIKGEIFFNATAIPPLRNHITSDLAAFATHSQPFRYQITGSRNETSYSASGLPAGLSVSTKTGLISGSPTAEGTFAVTIGADDGVQKATASLQLNVGSLSRYGGLVTAMALVSEPGEFIGGGTDRLLTPASGYFSAGASADGNSVGVAHAAYSPFFAVNVWRTAFTAPAGQKLVVGQYNVDPNNPSGAHMEVSGDGRGCTQSSGTFRVNEVQTRTNGEVEDFHASFEQHCDGQTQTLRGTVWFNAAQAIASSPLTAAYVNQPFNYQIVANNAPISFAATNLPAGLALNPTAGIISGTPTVVGKYQIPLRADAGNTQANDTLTLSVVPVPTPTPTPAPTPAMNISVSTSQINEGQDAVFTCTSSAPVTHDTEVQYAVLLKAATSTTADYTLDPNVGHFLIPAGQTSGTVIFHAVKDNITEGPEIFGLKLLKYNGYKLGTQNKATVTVINVP